MTATIYYFSGTGNSLCVARDIAAKIGGSLIPIASISQQPTITIDSDITGIVFPVYYGELPVIIKRFAEKMDSLENKYIFAVCTFGGSAGYSLKFLREIVRSHGGDISATYRVHMPQNSFAKPWERHNVLYATWNKQLVTVVKNTLQKKQGDYFKHFWLRPVFWVADYFVNLMKPSYRKSFLKISNASAELDTDQLIHLNDQGFSVNEQCTGCGICSRICPVNNIQMVNNKPIWQHSCENCRACFNWCPTKAIQGGLVANGFYYKHPKVKMTEIMQQQSNHLISRIN